MERGAPASGAPYTVAHLNGLIISASYANMSGGIRIAPELIMKINNRILHEIAFQIEAGNPLWGILFMNEYLTDESWLRSALLAQFRRRLASIGSGIPNALTRKLVGGVKARELSDDERLRIGARHVPSPRRIPSPRTRQERGSRVSATQSTGTSRRF